MKSVMITFIFICKCVFCFCLSPQYPLAFEFFTKLKCVNHVVVFSCDPLSNSFELLKYFHNEGRATSIALNRTKPLEIRDFLDRKIIARTGVFVDCQCDGCSEFLLQASQYRFFNQSYIWLINIDPHNIKPIVYSIDNIEINTDLTVASKFSNNTYNLIDIYCRGKRYDQPLIFQTYALWNPTSSFYKIHKLPALYSLKYRGDMSNMTLKGVTAINLPKIMHKDVDGLLGSPGITNGVSPFVKYHYALNWFLRDKYRFGVIYRVTRSWSGRIRGTYRLGSLGVLKRQEADIYGSGSFKRINRFDEFDYVHQSYKFKSVLVYRLTSSIAFEGSRGNLLAPFTESVWMCSLAAVILITIVLFIVEFNFVIEKQKPQRSATLSAVKTIAAFCQQGVEPISSSTPARVTVLTLMIAAVILYNYYTSSLVGSLLSSLPKGPATVRDIINSPMMVSFEDFGYNSLLFHQSNSSLIQDLYKKKMLPKRPKNSIPPYSSPECAVEYIRKGGTAYHADKNLIYAAIEKAFDVREVCDIRVIDGILENGFMMSIQPKQNMYTEMFRIALMRAQEVGLIDKTIKAYIPQEPKCLASAVVHPVGFNGIISAFFVLGVGMIISLTILLLEVNKCIKKWCIVRRVAVPIKINKHF